MKKYLISGIPPSQGGVGFLMYSLEELAIKKGYIVIYPRKNYSIRDKILNPYFILKELISRYYSKFLFIKKIKEIKDSEIVLLHPQTIGYKFFLKLVQNNIYIKNYIMDNSFFCIKSYNDLDGKECLQCVNALTDCNKKCLPFPIKYNKSNNLRFLSDYKKLASKINFYAQNESQIKLLKNHFGTDINVTLIGLKTNELFPCEKTNMKNSYDIVYHGANIEAKGINYFISLAKELPNYSFFIPSTIDDEDLPKNIYCEDINWSNGLKEIISSSRLVMNPSIWSAPVEGALLKSIYYNGNVAVVKTEYGFGNDIPDKCLLKLSPEISLAKVQVKEHLENEIDKKRYSKEWLEVFLNKQCKIEYLFV